MPCYLINPTRAKALNCKDAKSRTIRRAPFIFRTIAIA